MSSSVLESSLHWPSFRFIDNSSGGTIPYGIPPVKAAEITADGIKKRQPASAQLICSTGVEMDTKASSQQPQAPPPEGREFAPPQPQQLELDLSPFSPVLSAPQPVSSPMIVPPILPLSAVTDPVSSPVQDYALFADLPDSTKIVASLVDGREVAGLFNQSNRDIQYRGVIIPAGQTVR